MRHLIKIFATVHLDHLFLVLHFFKISIYKIAFKKLHARNDIYEVTGGSQLLLQNERLLNETFATSRRPIAAKFRMRLLSSLMKMYRNNELPVHGSFCESFKKSRYFSLVFYEKLKTKFQEASTRVAQSNLWTSLFPAGLYAGLLLFSAHMGKENI